MNDTRIRNAILKVRGGYYQKYFFICYKLPIFYSSVFYCHSLFNFGNRLVVYAILYMPKHPRNLLNLNDIQIILRIILVKR